MPLAGSVCRAAAVRWWGDREDMLLQIMEREPFLLVLNGLER